MKASANIWYKIGSKWVPCDYQNYITRVPDKALPHMDIGGEFKKRARTMQREARNHAQFDNSPPISMWGRTPFG
jgi:hypothetical protein